MRIHTNAPQAKSAPSRPFSWRGNPREPVQDASVFILLLSYQGSCLQNGSEDGGHESSLSIPRLRVWVLGFRVS